MVVSNQGISVGLRKKALVVGLDYYGGRKHNLKAGVKDATAVKYALEYNADETRNFEVDLDLCLDLRTPLTARRLENKLLDLFNQELDVALFYFAGHGGINRSMHSIHEERKPTLGRVFVNDAHSLEMSWLMDQANQSKAKHTIIVLDCCHAGAMGNCPERAGFSKLGYGVTIIAAAEDHDYSKESSDSGVFTGLFVEALKGGAAANLYGEITASSIYAYIDSALGHWDQRPVFKSNVRHEAAIKIGAQSIDKGQLSEIVKLFKEPGSLFPLDPTYEPTSSSRIPENCDVFALLQRLNRINIVVPENAEHMYYAAINSTGCRLTDLGRHYWHLASMSQ